MKETGQLSGKKNSGSFYEEYRAKLNADIKAAEQGIENINRRKADTLSDTAEKKSVAPRRKTV